MKKAFYYFMGLLSVATGLAFLYQFLSGTYNSLTVALGFECCIATIIFIIVEPRPRKTDYQKKEDDRIVNQGVGILLMIVVAAVIVMFAAA
jgi:hypothetical protein